MGGTPSGIALQNPEIEIANFHGKGSRVSGPGFGFRVSGFGFRVYPVGNGGPEARNRNDRGRRVSIVDVRVRLQRHLMVEIHFIIVMIVGPTSRHGILNYLFQVALHLPSYHANTFPNARAGTSPGLGVWWIGYRIEEIRDRCFTAAHANTRRARRVDVRVRRQRHLIVFRP